MGGLQYAYKIWHYSQIIFNEIGSLILKISNFPWVS